MEYSYYFLFVAIVMNLFFPHGAPSPDLYPFLNPKIDSKSLYVPPSLEGTPAATKDIVINPATNVTARLFLPSNTAPGTKVGNVVLYFHGGGFCIGSSFDKNDTIYLSSLSAESNALIISVNYRLYPPHTLPAAYQDGMESLDWVAAHKLGKGTEPWLNDHADFTRGLFVGGDSAGGNLVHHILMNHKQQQQDPVDPSPSHSHSHSPSHLHSHSPSNSPSPSNSNSIHIHGAILAMPYFLASNLPGVPDMIFLQSSVVYKIWPHVCPSCKAGVDDPCINPMAPDAPSLAGLACDKMLVYMAENDCALRPFYESYVQAVKASGWKGQLKVIEALKPNGHVFHILHPDWPATHTLVHDIATFIRED